MCDLVYIYETQFVQLYNGNIVIIGSVTQLLILLHFIFSNYSNSRSLIMLSLKEGPCKQPQDNYTILMSHWSEFSQGATAGHERQRNTVFVLSVICLAKLYILFKT